MSMQIIPAIDLLDGSVSACFTATSINCKIYDLDPIKLAEDYAAAGAAMAARGRPGRIS